MTNRLKLAMLCIVLTGLIAPAASQGFDFDSQGVSSAEESLLDGLNQILVTYEVNSVAEFVFFFLAPLVGFYMINVNMFEIGFESFEKRIGRNDYPYAREDEVPTGLKAIAFVAAFLTVQVAGLLGSIAILIAGVLAFGSWFLTQVGVFSDWTADGARTAAEDAGGGGVDPDAIAERVREELEEGEEAEEEAAEDEETGMPEEAEQAIERALSAFEGAEGDLLELLEYEQMEIARHTGNLQQYDIPNEFVNIVNNLEQSLSDLENGIDNDIGNWHNIPQGQAPNYNGYQDFINQVKQGNVQNVENEAQNLKNLYSNNPGIDFSAGGDFNNSWNNNAQNLINLTEELMALTNKLERLETGVLENDLEEVIEELERLRSIGKFLSEIENHLDVITSEEEYLVQMVKKAKDKNLDWGGRLTSDKAKARQLKSELEDLERRFEDEIENGLKDLYYGLENVLSADKNELQDILTGSQNLNIEGLKTDLHRLYAINEFVEGAYDNFPHQDSLNKLYGRTANATQKLSNIEQSLNPGPQNTNPSHINQELRQIGQFIENELGVNL